MNSLAVQRSKNIIPFILQHNSIVPKIHQPVQLTYLSKFNIISTKEFEREKPKLSKMKALLKEFMLLMVDGTKEAYKDVKWLAGTYQKKSHRKFTGFELREEQRILYDAFKFLPFSTFLVIPGAEFFLPLYLLFFPNSVPTWYIFDHTWDARIEKQELRQKEAHSVLIHKLRDFLSTKGVSNEDFLSENKYKNSFMKSKKDLDRKLNINNFSSDELLEVGKFLGMDIISGTFIKSTFFNMMLNMPKYFINAGFYLAGSQKRFEFEHWIFSHQIKLNFGPFEYLKRGFLRYQINRHINTLRKQDTRFFKFGMHDVTGHQITDFARERGITTISCYETLKVFLQQDWVTVCLRLSNNQLIWYAIMQYDFLEHANQDFN